MMLHIQSAFWGLLSGVATAVAFTVLWVSLVLFRARKAFPQGEVGVDVTALWRHPWFRLVVIAGFTAGYYWRYTRGHL